MAEVAGREKVKVRFYTSLYLIEGEVTVIGGYHGRLSDMLNDQKLFIAVSGALIHDLGGKLVSTVPFLSINKNTIQLVVPA